MLSLDMKVGNTCRGHKNLTVFYDQVKCKQNVVGESSCDSVISVYSAPFHFASFQLRNLEFPVYKV